MDYQVWTKEEYGETYTKVDCGDLAAAKSEINKAYQLGKAPLLTVDLPYEVSIKISPTGEEEPPPAKTPKELKTKVTEEVKVEAIKGKAEPGEDPGAKGKGEVRSGDLGAVPELGEGSGDPGAGDSVSS